MTAATCSASPATEGGHSHGWEPAAARDAGRHPGGTPLLWLSEDRAASRRSTAPSPSRSAMDEAKDAKAKAAMPAWTCRRSPEEELVSRPVQAGIGLFTGVVVYSALSAGFSLWSSRCVYGRIGPLGPRATSALLAGMGFVAVYLVPNLKYPANPPSVGDARDDRHAHGPLLRHDRHFARRHDRRLDAAPAAGWRGWALGRGARGGGGLSRRRGRGRSAAAGRQRGAGAVSGGRPLAVPDRLARRADR